MPSANLQEEMDEDLGNYLAEMLEGNPNYEDTSGATFKSLICDWYNGGSSTILPSLGVQDDLPVVEGYYLMQTDVSGVDQILRKVTAEEGYVADCAWCYWHGGYGRGRRADPSGKCQSLL